MILEDVMLLKPGQTVTFIVLNHHYILTSNQMEKKKWYMLKDTMTYNPLKPVQFGTKIFFVMSLTVSSNTHYENSNVGSKYYNTAKNLLSSPN